MQLLWMQQAAYGLLLFIAAAHDEFISCATWLARCGIVLPVLKAGEHLLEVFGGRTQLVTLMCGA